MFIQIRQTWIVAKYIEISHKSAVGSNKKMVAGKYYNRYYDVSYNNRITCGGERPMPS